MAAESTNFQPVSFLIENSDECLTLPRNVMTVLHFYISLSCLRMEREKQLSWKLLISEKMESLPSFLET